MLNQVGNYTVSTAFAFVLVAVLQPYFMEAIPQINSLIGILQKTVFKYLQVFGQGTIPFGKPPCSL